MKKGVVLVAVLIIAGYYGFRWWQRQQPDNLGPPSFDYFRKPTETKDKLIVFVHGFNSDSRTAWTNTTNSAYWPKLMADDHDFDRFAIATAGFYSPLLRHAGSIEQAATTVGERLRREHVYDRFQQIVFIAHSTGGLVVRRALSELYTPKDEALLKRVSAALFFATPTSGAPKATLGKWLSANPQTANLDPSETNGVLAIIDNSWESLLRARATTLNNRPKVYCGYEIFDTKFGQIVPELYSKTMCDERPQPFNRDHETLVKPASNTDQDDVYSWTKSRLLGSTSRPVHWDGGEVLGILLERLQRGYQVGSIPEQVTLAPAAAAVVSSLYIPLSPYDRNSWGELLQVVASQQRCLDVRVDALGRTELDLKGPVKQCRAGRETWTVCASSSCAR
jgi:pimeloyl-ACP methyl ester carboxylesterase